MSGIIVKATWLGLDDVVREIGAWDGGISWADGELKRLAEEIAARARDLVPVDTGALFGTIHVVQPRDARGRYRVGWAIVAGGTSAPYAIYVHEDLRARHDRGQAKFMEKSAVEVFNAWHANVQAMQVLR